MAVREALAVILRDWPDIEPLLTVGELRQLADLGELPSMRGARPGFTWEHPAHLCLKRAKSSALALGTADRHRASLASLVDLPG